MSAKTFTAYGVPAPFHALHLLVLREPDGEDEDSRHYRDHLYMLDQDAEGGKVRLKTGPRVSFPKFHKVAS